MTSKAIQTLMDEHEVISDVENIIVMLRNYWEIDAGEYEKCVHSLIQFFREYSDKYHHQKEEEVLFPEIKAHHEFIQTDIIDELFMHHDDFRSNVDSIETAIKDKEYDKTQKLLSVYINELLDHIAIEDDELFVMADTLLSEDQLEIVYHKCNDIDLELGVERKEELAAIIKQVERILLQ